jgi:hypothetical protein
MTDNYLYCDLCNYKTTRNYNLKRHHNTQHIKNELNENDKINDIQNNIIEDKLYCCNKEYKTKKNIY